MPITKHIDIVKRMYEKRNFLVLVFTNLLAQLGIT